MSGDVTWFELPPPPLSRTTVERWTRGGSVPIGRRPHYAVGDSTALRLVASPGETPWTNPLTTTAGELWVAGDALALGYVRNSGDDGGSTRSAFRVAPDGNTRWFQTGDVCRYAGDELFCVGRVDNQVKIRGHRVALEAIEVPYVRNTRHLNV